jgi:hypothetical protein
MSATVWPVRHVLAESLQAGAPAGVDELVVVHGRIIPETTQAPTVVPRADKPFRPDPKEARAMLRSVIAFVLIVAGLLAAACTNPSSGGGATAAPPAAPASSAPKPGY